jgi:hypothetical protein
MRNTKTIGGGSPFDNPTELFAQGLGMHIIAMSSTKYCERRAGYISLMSLRRFFTIDQWTAFQKSMDTFRKEHGFFSLTEMMHSISNEMIYESVENKSNSTTTKEESMTKTVGTMATENGTELRQLIEGLAKVTAQLAELTNRAASIIPVLPLQVTVDNDLITKKAEPEKKKTKKSKEITAEEKLTDYKKLCRECVASLCRHFQDLGPARDVFAKHEVNGLNSAPAEKLPAIYEDLKAEVEKIPATEGE